MQERKIVRGETARGKMSLNPYMYFTSHILFFISLSSFEGLYFITYLHICLQTYNEKHIMDMINKAYTNTSHNIFETPFVVEFT